MIEIKNAIISVILIVLLLCIIKKKLTWLEAFVFLIPFKSISFEFGLQLYGYQLVFIIIFARIVLFKKKVNYLFDFGIILFIIYVIISTILISNFYMDYIKNNYFSTFFRTEGRYISSLIKFVFFEFGIVFVIFNALKNEAHIHRMIKLYLSGLVLLSMFGLAQIFIGYASNINIFPLQVEVEQGKDFESLVFEALGIIRLSSLGGEPKGMASSMVAGIAIVAYLIRYKIKVSDFQKYYILLFLLCLMLTLSTGGLALAFVFSIIFVITGLRSHAFWKITKGKILALLVTILIGVLFSDKISVIIKSRILERKDQIVNEEVDKYIQQFLLENPQWLVFGSGNGNIHNLVNPLVKGSPEAYYLANNIFVSRYGYMKIISEHGIFGFFLFSLAVFAIIIKLSNLKYESTGRFLYYSFISLLVFFFARSNYIISEFMFIAGLSLVYIKYSDRIKIVKKS